MKYAFYRKAVLGACPVLSLWLGFAVRAPPAPSLQPTGQPVVPSAGPSLPPDFPPGCPPLPSCRAPLVAHLRIC